MKEATNKQEAILSELKAAQLTLKAQRLLGLIWRISGDDVSFQLSDVLHHMVEWGVTYTEISLALSTLEAAGLIKRLDAPLAWVRKEVAP